MLKLTRSQEFDLVALDIDDTVINVDDVITPRVARSIRGVSASAAQLVFATGRGTIAAAQVLEELNVGPCHAISGDGGVIFQWPTFEVLKVETFDPSPWVTEAASGIDSPMVAVEVVGRGYRVNAPFPPGELGGNTWVEPLESLLRGEVARAIVRDPNDRSSPPH